MQNKSVNKVMLVGRVGKDPEINTIGTDNSVAKFSLATTESFNKNGNWEDVTQWHSCVCFGKLAEIVRNHVYKGALVSVEGKLKSNKWTTKDGQERISFEVHLSEVVILTKQQQQPYRQSQQQQQQSHQPPAPTDSGAPF